MSAFIKISQKKTAWTSTLYFCVDFYKNFNVWYILDEKKTYDLSHTKHHIALDQGRSEKEMAKFFAVVHNDSNF